LHRIVSRRPSPATIISLVALFVALGGTSYAAIALAPNNSVGSAQVINGSLLKKDLSKKTVAALKGNRGLRGAQGPAGAQGAAGAAGSSGAAGATGATGPAGAPNPNAVDSQKLGGLGPESYQKVPTVAQHFTIPATALVDVDGVGRDEVSGTASELCTVSGGDRLQAAVHLPQGVTIAGYSVDYHDDSGSGGSNGSAWVTRVPLFGKGGTYNDIFGTLTLANTAVAGDTANVSTTTPTGTAGVTTVDNTKYAYTVITDPSTAAAAICGLDVTYTVPSGFAATAPDTGTAPNSTGSASNH
jgi:hypothetical protein